MIAIEVLCQSVADMLLLSKSVGKFGGTKLLFVLLRNNRIISKVSVANRITWVAKKNRCSYQPGIPMSGFYIHGRRPITVADLRPLIDHQRNEFLLYRFTSVGIGVAPGRSP